MKCSGKRSFAVLLAALLAAGAAPPQPSTPAPTPLATPAGAAPFSLGRDQFGKEPTYIKSDTLTLNTSERKFLYTGSVEVHQGDLTLTSAELEGAYSEQNKIQTMVARTNVIIEKADLKARSEKANYEQASDTLVLTENPEVQQNGSVLTADTIRILLREDRSVAEGSVRVKMVQPTPSPAPKDPAKGAPPAAAKPPLKIAK